MRGHFPPPPVGVSREIFLKIARFALKILFSACKNAQFRAGAAPNDVDVHILSKKMNDDAEELGLGDVILQLAVPHCESDFRRTVVMLD